VSAAVFVDRDGVVNELVPDPLTGLPESPLQVSDTALIPGVVDALRRLAGAKLLLVGVSNQPAAAKGTVSRADLEAVHARVVELLAAEGVRFDDFRICFHHPDAGCACRKPAPGLLLSAAAELGIDLERSWMIGDSDADVVAGRQAGCRTVLVEHAGSSHRRTGAAPDLTAPTLAAAVDALL